MSDAPEEYPKFSPRTFDEPILLSYLDRQSGVEIHLSDVAFTQGGKFKVFWNHDRVAEGDDIRKTLAAAINRIARLRAEKEHRRECIL